MICPICKGTKRLERAHLFDKGAPCWACYDIATKTWTGTVRDSWFTYVEEPEQPTTGVVLPE